MLYQKCGFASRCTNKPHFILRVAWLVTARARPIWWARIGTRRIAGWPRSNRAIWARPLPPSPLLSLSLSAARLGGSGSGRRRLWVEHRRARSDRRRGRRAARRVAGGVRRRAAGGGREVKDVVVRAARCCCCNSQIGRAHV